MSHVPAGAATSIMRLGYRIASRMIDLDRAMRRSHGRGVKLLIDDGDGAILLVRHTYGHRHWTLPGGGVRTAEIPAQAALREATEELGLATASFESLGTYPARPRRRIEVVSVFSAVAAPSQIEPRAVEIEHVGWFPASCLPADRDPTIETAIGLRCGHEAERAAERHRAA